MLAGSAAAPLALALAVASSSPGWVTSLRNEISRIDRETPGELGVYVKSLRDDEDLGYQADRKWYLASTAKVPIAIVALQMAEDGQLDLEEELALRRSDYVDGAGSLLREAPGGKFSLGTLIEKMITESDSTATDMLIRRIGVARLNEWVRSRLGLRSFGPLTTLLQVRHDAYGELHPKARELTNLDFIELKRIKDPKARLEAFRAKLKIERGALRKPSIDEAFESYYRRGLNSAGLEELGSLLERLHTGKLLKPGNTDRLLGYMERMKTGEKRIKAGLPATARFAQKTGTQVRRMCNIGVIRAEGVIVAMCLEKFDDPAQGEAAMKRIGESLATSGLIRPNPASASGGTP